MIRIAIAIFLTMFVCSAAAADELSPDLPGGNSVELSPFTTGTIVAGTARLTVAGSRPTSWSATTVGSTLLLAPDDNPFDLGILILWAPSETAPTPKAIVESVFEQSTMGSTEKVLMATGAEADLQHWDAVFPDGRQVHIQTVVIEKSGLQVVGLAAGGQEGEAPWRGVLRQLLQSITITTTP